MHREMHSDNLSDTFIVYFLELFYITINLSNKI